MPCAPAYNVGMFRLCGSTVVLLHFSLCRHWLFSFRFFFSQSFIWCAGANRFNRKHGGYSTAIRAFYYIFFSYRSLSFCRFDYSRFGNLPIWLIRNILHILTYVYWFVGIISISDDDEASNQHSLAWKHHFSCRICVCVCVCVKENKNIIRTPPPPPILVWLDDVNHW